MAKKVVATNPTAKHNYSIEKTLEAGIVLEKILIDTGGLKPSYLGAPESNF